MSKSYFTNLWKLALEYILWKDDEKCSTSLLLYGPKPYHAVKKKNEKKYIHLLKKSLLYYS